MTQDIARLRELSEREEAPRYLLVKRDLYYCPDNMGYTGVKDRAGRYHASKADSKSGVTAIHEDDAPMFSKACWEDVKVNHLLAQLEAATARIGVLESERDALREATTPSGYTKADYIGEFKFPVCHRDEDGEEVWHPTTVPWDTIKEIMGAISTRAARTALARVGESGE